VVMEAQVTPEPDDARGHRRSAERDRDRREMPALSVPTESFTRGSPCDARPGAHGTLDRQPGQSRVGSPRSCIDVSPANSSGVTRSGIRGIAMDAGLDRRGVVEVTDARLTRLI
jgi:hypothetical protein